MSRFFDEDEMHVSFVSIAVKVILALTICYALLRLQDHRRQLTEHKKEGGSAEGSKFQTTRKGATNDRRTVHQS